MIHVIQVIIAGWNNFRSVVSGFEIVQESTLLVPMIIVEESAPLVTTILLEESTPLSTTNPEEKIIFPIHEDDSNNNLS